jgi:hypothetical protein
VVLNRASPKARRCTVGHPKDFGKGPGPSFDHGNREKPRSTAPNFAPEGPGVGFLGLCLAERFYNRRLLLRRGW